MDKIFLQLLLQFIQAVVQEEVNKGVKQGLSQGYVSVDGDVEDGTKRANAQVALADHLGVDASDLNVA